MTYPQVEDSDLQSAPLMIFLAVLRLAAFRNAKKTGLMQSPKEEICKSCQNMAAARYTGCESTPCLAGLRHAQQHSSVLSQVGGGCAGFR